MKKLNIYHGSSIIIEKPLFGYGKKYNDYGQGFYCTQNLDLAKEWANRRSEGGFANKYQIDERGLKVLDLCDKSHYSVLDWIAILAHNREFPATDKVDYEEAFAYLEKRYIDVSQYDVVIGYRADDAYFRFPLMFIRGVLTYERLEEIYLLGNLGKQYVLVSEKAFQRIRFLEAIPAEPLFHERFIRRTEAADSSYLELEREERNREGTRIMDLVRK